MRIKKIVCLCQQSYENITEAYSISSRLLFYKLIMPGDYSACVYACLVILASDSTILLCEEFIRTKAYLMHKWPVEGQMVPEPAV